MGTVAFGVLVILGLLGFIAAMCIIVYLFWRRPKPELHLPDGQYHIHFVANNPRTGAPIYDMDEIVAEPAEAAKKSFEDSDLTRQG